MEGPYAAVRHPQYTGIFLAVFGEGVMHWPTVFSLAAFPIIVGAYVLLAGKEERQMTDTYGDRYLEYQKRVPCSSRTGATDNGCVTFSRMSTTGI